MKREVYDELVQHPPVSVPVVPDVKGVCRGRGQQLGQEQHEEKDEKGVDDAVPWR